MADTLGDIRFSILKRPQFAGTDTDYLDAVINEVYMEIIRSFPWTLLTVDSILQTTAVYSTGTVAVTEGSTGLTGTGTTWTTGMSGRMFRVDGQNEPYVFTRTGDTTATIDRAYESSDDTDATYKIFQNIYAVASDVGVIQSIKVYGSDDELDEVSQETLDEADPSRLEYGRPRAFAQWEDDTSTPPVAQVELYPVPTDSEGLPYRYTKRVSRLSDPATYVLPWVSSACLIAGAIAELTQPGTFITSPAYNVHLDKMKAEDVRRMAPRQIKMADRFTQHRRERALGHSLEEWRRWKQMP